MSKLKSNVSIGMGLLPLEVDVFSIVGEERSTSLSNACVGAFGGEPHDPIRISQKNICPTCENDDKKTHVKVRVVGKSELVVVPQDELDAMATEAEKFTKVMPITVHPASDVESNTLETGTAYYLAPSSPTFAEIYALVVNAIKKHPEKALVTLWAVRSAPALYRFTVRDDVLVVRQLAFPHQVQAAPKVPTEFNPAWEAQADMFIDSNAAEFDPTTYRDVRGDILAAYVASQTPVFSPEVTEGKVAAPAGIDVMALLEASIKKAPAVKKAAAKKPAKKAVAKAS